MNEEQQKQDKAKEFVELQGLKDNLLNLMSTMAKDALKSAISSSPSIAEMMNHIIEVFLQRVAERYPSFRTS